MDDEATQDLCRTWSGLNTRMIRLMEPCDSRYGIIFLSQDASGNGAAKLLARHLTRSIVVFDFARKAPQKNEWKEKMAFLTDENEGASLLRSAPKKPCIIVAGLDRGRDWVFSSLKALMDHRKVSPFNCLATVASLETIPDWLWSHFWICRKLGGPRKSNTKGEHVGKLETTKMIVELSDQDEVNAHLRLGWTLVKTLRATEKGTTHVKYILAWQKTRRPSKPRKKTL